MNLLYFLHFFSQIASCGHHSNSIVFHKGGIEEESYQFEVDGIINIYDIACYKLEERHLVAIATDDHTVLSYSYCSGNVNDDPFAEVGVATQRAFNLVNKSDNHIQ